MHIPMVNIGGISFIPFICEPSWTDPASLRQTEALLAGVLAAAKAALPWGLDLLVWGTSRLGDQAITLRYLLANGEGTSWTPSKDDDELEGGNSCLRVASRMGHEGAVRELFESGVDVDEVGADDRSTALHLAAWEGHKGVVEQLVKAGAGVDKARAGDGRISLYCVARAGNEGMVEQLLKAGGADVNNTSTRYLWVHSPLHYCCAYQPRGCG